MRRAIITLLASYFAACAHVHPDPVALLGLDSRSASSDGGSTRALDSQPDAGAANRFEHDR